MPYISQRAKLQLSTKEIEELGKIKRSHTQGLARFQRANILLSYHQGETVSAIAKRLKTNRPKVERTINRALQVGALASLNDYPRSGKPASISADAKAWILSIACQKPKDLGYASELWTMASLAKHVRMHCQEAGHPSLSKVDRGTMSKILSKAEIRPHKIDYYLQRRDPQFKEKMAQVLHIYKEVELLKTPLTNQKEQTLAILSYDERPGIQAIKNIAPDLPVVP